MDEITVTRRDALVAAGTVGAVGVGALGFAGVIGLVSDGDEETQTTLVAARTAAPAPVDDPDAAAWDSATQVTLPLFAQQLVPPSLDVLGVSEIRVKALHDGSLVAFRLEWDDGTVDDLDGIGEYHDAVAVMLPTAAAGAAGATGAAAKPPPITMGAPKQPVHILQWRATWQRDVDSGGKTGVDQIYPRVIHDVMPDDILPPAEADLYWVGRAAGNPLSQTKRTSPVEQVVAEGFGTTTHLARTDARGHGANDGSRWRVALGIPAARTDVAAPLEPGAITAAAFAVWLGSQENRGGRKQYADWIPFRLAAT